MKEMQSNNIPEYIRKIISLRDISACKAYIKVFTDFLFDLMKELGEKKISHSSERMSEADIWVQMIFTNALAISRLLDGISYERKGVRLNPFIDHRMVFALTRTLYENLIAFELVYILPLDDDKKTFMYYLYAAAGYKEQLDCLSGDRDKYPERIASINEALTDAEQKAKSTEYYKNVDIDNKRVIDNALKSGRYRYRINEKGVLEKAEWENAMKMIGVNSEALDGLYKYFSNLSHPSHWGQLQFQQSFESQKSEYINLVCYATRCVILFLSIFVKDFERLVPETCEVLSGQAYDNRQMIMLYEHRFRGARR